MKNLSNFNLLIIILLFSSCQQQPFTGTVHIIPYPNQIAIGTQYRPIGKNLSIYLSPESGMDKDYIEDLLSDTGVKCKFTNFKWIADLTFDIEPDTIGLEGYRLVSNDYGTKITASDTKGLFYGLQTFRQLITSQNNTLVIPFVEIADSPKFLWRALMLDEGRYFKGKEEVKKLLDEMARLKMNTFHWHLTDDQGWRIEIKKYPLLTKIGGKRDSTQIGNWNSNIYDGKVHEGFYTQEEIKEIIDYAAKRQITIVPEIEMPGHASAAIAAYPQLGTEKQSIKVPTRFGVQYHAYNVADPKVIQFIKDVLDEVCNLFPSETIHIGGDEVKYDQWKKSAQVRNFMKEQNIKTPADLQIWFTNTISHYLENQKKHMMGWNEITGVKIHDYTDFEDAASGASLAEGTIVHFWRGDPSLIKQTVKKGYQVVNSYHEYTYLDYDTAYTSLEKAYHFDPLAGITGKKTDLIIGIGAQMWGEWIPTPSDMYRKLYPRIAALAECGWTSPSNKSWKRFNQAAYKENLRWKQLYQ